VTGARRHALGVPGVVERVGMCVVAVVLTAASFAHKLSCTAPETGPDGTPVPWLTRVTRTGCFADTATLFTSRDLAAHVFPYVHSTYTPDPPALHGGTVEYPTLTGLWAWASALPVSSVQGFLVLTMLSFVPAVVVTTLCLQRLSGRRAWIWAGTPPLALYALYNWDVLPVVATAVGLLVALRGPRRWSPTTRAVVAGAAFGVGGALKLYPVMFVVPLALAFLLDRGDASRRARWRCAGGAGGAAMTVLLSANLPFAIVNPAAWLSVFRFQATRPIDATTLSVWWYGPGLVLGSGTPGFQQLLGVAATVSTAVGIVVVLAAGIVIGLRVGTLPWVQTAAAMLCVYLLCNKVHSLQYVLWLLPFFAIVRIRIGWVVAYLLADLGAFVGWYRTNYYHSLGHLEVTWADQALTFGVWGRAVLLAVLAVVFLRSRTTVQAELAPSDAHASPGGLLAPLERLAHDGHSDGAAAAHSSNGRDRTRRDVAS
jgi:uncharacterized membrane protein